MGLTMIMHAVGHQLDLKANQVRTGSMRSTDVQARIDRLAHLAACALCAPLGIIAVQHHGIWQIVGAETTVGQGGIDIHSPDTAVVLAKIGQDGLTTMSDMQANEETVHPDGSHHRPPNAYAAYSFPLADGRARGLVCVVDVVARQWDARTEPVLCDCAHLVGLLLTPDEVCGVATDWLRAQELERQHIARELHDELGQQLTIIQMALQDLQEASPSHLRHQLAMTLDLVAHLQEKVRAMALDLRPAQLDDLGLVPALRCYLARQGSLSKLDFTVDLLEDLPRLAPDLEITCFRIVQEALTNVLRSARAQRVWVYLRLEGSWLSVGVLDDGQGFDVLAAHAHAREGHSLGLLGMQERAALVGGRVQVTSTPGQGSQVRAWLPMQVREAV